jgi:hypothetical protein
MQHIVKVKLTSLAIVALGALLQLAPVHADVVKTRCNGDLLSAAKAKLRLEWARACGAKINVVSPAAPIFPAMAYLIGINDTAGIPLWEYIENDDFWGRNSYSGDSGAGINQIFTQSQWRTGPYTATTAAGGFQKWTESSTLALTRPTYPIFGNSSDINFATPLFPNPNYSLLDCNFYTNAAGTVLANVSTTGFYVNAYCDSNICGDGVCSSNENASTCGLDCRVCGDGICSIGETSTCPSDCGSTCTCNTCIIAPCLVACPLALCPLQTSEK